MNEFLRMGINELFRMRLTDECVKKQNSVATPMEESET